MITRWCIIKQNVRIILRECVRNFIRFTVPKETGIWKYNVKEKKKLIWRVTVGFKTKHICSESRQCTSLYFRVNGITAYKRDKNFVAYCFLRSQNTYVMTSRALWREEKPLRLVPCLLALSPGSIKCILLLFYSFRRS
jgi:hypothetical protein